MRTKLLSTALVLGAAAGVVVATGALPTGADRPSVELPAAAEPFAEGSPPVVTVEAPAAGVPEPEPAPARARVDVGVGEPPEGSSRPGREAPAGPAADPREPQTPQAPDALSVLEAAAARYRAASTLCADFRQELSIPLLGERRSGRGLLCQQQPDLFMMRFSDPEGDRVVADGEYLWVYTPSSEPGQVIRAHMSNAQGSFDFHREFLEDPARKYDARLEGQETIAGSRTHRILLVPRAPAGYRDAVLWIDERSLVRRVEIREENGSVRTVSLDNVELNGTPPPDAFRFTPPPGTQVLTP